MNIIDDDHILIDCNNNNEIEYDIGSWIEIYDNNNLNIFNSDVHIITSGSGGDIIFTSYNNFAITINSLPTTFAAKHSTSNITISIPIIVNR